MILNYEWELETECKSYSSEYRPLVYKGLIDDEQLKKISEIVNEQIKYIVSRVEGEDSEIFFVVGCINPQDDSSDTW